MARSDLEVARGVVADLAAASSVIHPGLDWAVGVARGGQGIPQYWIASNEGLGGYIPAGVFVPRSMPVVGDVDGGHWMGWCNPAETVVRAIRARGESVSAVATSFMSRSEMIDEDAAIRDVAVGVPPVPGGPDQAEASQHLQSRAHRLETVASGLFHELSAADRAVVDAYARHLTQQAVFSSGLPELSETAQAVARAVLSGDWPSAEEWSALRDEYSSARLMAGSQRPGVNGNWEREQAVAYQYDFVACQRLETLVCWERDSRADVVYAAWAAGVPTPSLALLKA
ncbi:chemotaxis protein [Mycobacterium sp. DSM 3803]|nr:chemotaxis protein [Mycobacterium sp. DSM 3803]